MPSSLSYPTRVDLFRLPTFWEKLRFLIPEIISTVALSIVISGCLTMISYLFSSAFGLPIMPFFFILI